jgi:hypothetical protein
MHTQVDAVQTKIDQYVSHFLVTLSGILTSLSLNPDARNGPPRRWPRIGKLMR